MRICLTIHHDLDPDAGAPGATLRLAQEYRELGHEVELLDFTRITPFLAAPQAKQLAFPWAVATWLGKFAPKPFDIIDASTGDAWVLGLLRRRIASARNALLVTRSHGLEHTAAQEYRSKVKAGLMDQSWKYPLYHGGYRLWEVRHSLISSDVALFLNAGDRNHAIDRLGVHPERALVVRNGISQAFIGLPLTLPAGKSRHIAIVGSYIPRKGTAYAASALRDWLPKNRRWKVTFLGTGSKELDVLADYPKNLHEQINIIPHYKNSDLPLLLSGSSIHLFPTLSEGGPLALLETMACGLAPVVSDLSALRSVVRDGHNGLVIPPATPSAIVQALERLTADTMLLDNLRVNAHRTAQSYGWVHVAAEQLNIYKERRSIALNQHVSSAPTRPETP